MVQTPPKKRPFFGGGGSRASDDKDLGYVSDRKINIITRPFSVLRFL
eukprot:UN04593